MATKPNIAVLGGGNGAFITAADLKLRGHRVSICEVPEFENNIEGILKSKSIELQIVGNPGIHGGLAKLDVVTTDPKEALSGADVVLVVVPAFGQKRFAEVCAPHLEDGQVVVLTPGNFGGAIEFARVLRAKGNKREVKVAEMECMIYSGFKSEPTVAWVSGYKKGLRVAAYPGSDTPGVMRTLLNVYADVRAAKNVLETGLRNINTVVHAPILIHNAGWAEKTKGDFLFYWDGCTPAVARTAEAVDRERISLGKRFGLTLDSMLEVSLEWYGHEGAKGTNLQEVLSTNPVYAKDYAPPTLQHRFLLEDIPYGMVPMESLGRLTGICTPVTSAIITLASELIQIDLRSRARDLNGLGMGRLSVQTLKKVVDRGPGR
ncbi:MAG TPA: NAD/NADP octopine/nopaline dehydrogenase family protein [Terriglobales bacterium]|nr:NAD/NADP octopine/nopaline dehydrogenase family protein [Terriglobales bacterium]